MGIKVNFATGFEIPPFFLQNKEIVKKLDENKGLPSLQGVFRGMSDDNMKEALLGVPHFDELMLKHDDEREWWTLPFDPVISVSGKNIIVRRNVLKMDDSVIQRGSVKELWSQDDYEVNIAGVFIGNAGEIPENDLMKLRKYCEERKIVRVYSQLLDIFGIRRLAIEDYALPFTKGMENQMFTIKAYSDTDFDLLIEETKP